MFVPISSWKMKNSQKCLVRPVCVSANFTIDPGMQRQCAVSCQTFWSVQRWLHGSSPHCRSIHLWNLLFYVIQSFGCISYLGVWEATVVVNGCFEEAERLVSFQRITCEIINWRHCVGCCYRRCYCVQQVRDNCSVFVDFVVSTYG